MKQRGVFLIGVILMGIYFFLFPRGTGRELVLLPHSYTSLISSDLPLAPVSGGMISIRSGDIAGYFDSNFDLVTRYQSGRMAVDDEWLVLTESEGLAILDPDGRLRARIPGDSIPVARNGTLYLYDVDIGRLSRVEPSNGAVIWSKDFLSSITVLESAAGRTLVGLLDGRALIIGEGGDVLLRYRPGGSRIEAVYGGDLSEDGKGLALISGLDPQRFILLEERKNGFRPVTHHDTGTDYRRYVPVGFIGDGSRVLYEGPDAVAAVDTDDFKLTMLDLIGRPAGWQYDAQTASLCLLGTDDGETTLRILSRHDLTFFKGILAPGTSALKIDGKHLMLIGDDYFGVMAMEVR